MERMLSKLRKFTLKDHNLLKQASLYSLASIAANFLHWVFALTALRLVGSSTFGIIGVFSSLNSLIGMFTGAISQTLERYLAYYHSSGQLSHAARLRFVFSRLALLSGLVCTFTLLFAHNQIAQYLHIVDANLIVLFAPSVFLYFILSYQRGVFKARLRFDIVGFMMVLEAITKIGILAIASQLHYSIVTVCVLSITLSLASSLVLGFIYIRRIREKTGAVAKTDDKLPYKEISFYAFNALLDDIGLGLLLNIDVLLVNKFFSDVDTGIYATLALFGKIVFLSGSMIGPLILPIAANILGKGKSGHKEFALLVGSISFVSASTILVFMLFPGFTIHFFAGEHGFATMPYLGLYFLGIWTILITRSISSWYQAKKKFFVSRLMIGGAVSLAGGIYLFHSVLSEVVALISLVGVVMVTISLAYHFLTLRKEKRS